MFGSAGTDAASEVSLWRRRRLNLRNWKTRSGPARARRDNTRAEILSSLHQKIRASLRVAERLRLDTDIAAQLRAEAFAREVGPRPSADPKILKTLREALLAGMVVKFLYGEDSDAALR